MLKAHGQDPTEQIVFLNNFKEFIDASQHIAGNRIRKIRNSVVAKRDFTQELANLFQQVKASYRKEIEKLLKEKRLKDPTQVSFLEKNKKSAYVLLSSSTGFYGEIVRKTFNLFQQQFDPRQGDAVIIGKFGKILFENKYPGLEYTFFDFSEKTIEPENFRWVIEHLVRYQKILVFYGQFESLISQDAKTESISGDQVQANQAQEAISYLFEPSLENVMIFFETQIIAAIFEQTVFESQLAKFASRMLALQYAIENLDSELKKAQDQKLRWEHQLENQKQLERLTGRRLWKT